MTTVLVEYQHGSLCWFWSVRRQIDGNTSAVAQGYATTRKAARAKALAFRQWLENAS